MNEHYALYELNGNDINRAVKIRVSIVSTIADCIKEMGEISSGHLYAMVMFSGVSIETYQDAIELLENAGRITIKGGQLRWVS